MAKCKFCSAEIPGDSTFCPFCGNREPVAEASVASGFVNNPQPQPEPPKKSQKGLIAGIVAGVIALILIAGTVLFFVFKDEITELFEKPASSDVTDEDDEDEEESEKSEEGLSEAVSKKEETTETETTTMPETTTEPVTENTGNTTINPQYLENGIIEVDGITYYLGVDTVNDFLSFGGWSLDGEAEYYATSDAGDINYQWLKKGNSYSICVYFYYETDMTVENGIICGVSVYRNDVPVEITDVVINNQTMNGIENAMNWTYVENYYEGDDGVETDYSYSNSDSTISFTISCPENGDKIIYIFYLVE